MFLLFFGVRVGSRDAFDLTLILTGIKPVYRLKTLRLGGRGRGVLTTSQIELEGSVSLPDLNPTAPIDLEQLLADVYEAVQWACLRYRGRIRRDELDDFSQQIILKLIEDNCRRLHSFKSHSSSKTWLQAVVDDHIYSVSAGGGRPKASMRLTRGRWSIRRRRTETFMPRNSGSCCSGRSAG